MVPDSPADALGSYAATVREVGGDVVRTRHGYAADAHQAAHTRNTRGYSTLWHDLLVDAQESFADRGFETYRVPPAGYKIPVINGCLVYLWRIPASGDLAHFAMSPTKRSLFGAPPLDPPLFGPDFVNDFESADPSAEEAAFASVVRASGETMPLVLVMFRSSPRQLQSIEWAVAEFVEETEEVRYHGQEAIWQPEFAVEAEAPDAESFDHGAPAMPTIEPRKQEGSDPDA